jgi:hypothetical protein
MPSLRRNAVQAGTSIRRWTMLTQDLASEVRADVTSLKGAQDKFLQTYRRLCRHYGGADWPKKKIEMVFHHVRQEIVPIMQAAGMDAKSVEGLCSWAEKQEMKA